MCFVTASSFDCKSLENMALVTSLKPFAIVELRNSSIALMQSFSLIEPHLEATLRSISKHFSISTRVYAGMLFFCLAKIIYHWMLRQFYLQKFIMVAW